MSDPVRVMEPISKRCEYEAVEYSYEEILDMFQDDTNLVKPLVLRCQKYEDEIKSLRKSLMRAESEVAPPREELS